ncbi:MAG: YggT family protein [Clostridiaceae bacterium]|nr:YggT family protein [Clostridiaceae bacterium]
MSGFQIIIISLRAVIGAMEVVILARVLCEFKAIRRDSRPFRLLLSISEPLLHPVRKILAKQYKNIKIRFDLSPFIVMIILYIINVLLRNSVK